MVFLCHNKYLSIWTLSADTNTLYNTPDEILEKIESRYYPQNCPELSLKKFKPLVEQLNLDQRIDENWGKCNCGRRHLDLVVALI